MVKLVDTLVLEASALCVTVRVRLEAPNNYGTTTNII